MEPLGNSTFQETISQGFVGGKGYVCSGSLEPIALGMIVDLKAPLDNFISKAGKLASISETEGVDCVAIRAVAILFLKEKINEVWW